MATFNSVGMLLRILERYFENSIKIAYEETKTHWIFLKKENKNKNINRKFG